MTALDVIKKSANLLNINDVLDDTALSSVTVANSVSVLENNSTLNRMFEILKIMITDISTDYVTIVKETEVNTTNKSIPLSVLNDFNRIIQVRFNKVPISFKIANNAINLDFDGSFIVKYKAIAKIDSLIDDINVFDGIIGYDLLVFGLTAMYCLAVGLFDEFNAYNTIYLDKLSAINSLKVIEMPTRRWE